MEEARYKNGIIISYQKKYYQENKEKKKLYYKENKEEKIAKATKWAKLNKDKRSKITAKYNKKRAAIDPLFKFKNTIRNRMYKFFKAKGYIKNKKTHEYLGCTYEKAIKYIESQFKEGMTWKNHGEWHIDHIKPLILATCEKEVIELCNYKNLQPLWAIENLIKKDKYFEEVQHS